MVDSVQNQLQNCLEEVNIDSDHDLSPKNRRLLFEAMNEEIQGDYESPVKISRVHYVRVQLAILCAKKVLPIWEKYIDVKHPHRMIEKSEAYLKGELSYDELDRDITGFYGGLANAETKEEIIAFPVGRTAAGAACVTLDDDIIVNEDYTIEERDNPSDPDLFDCAMWAANAYASGFIAMDTYDANRAYEFWTWYLNEAVPAAIATVT